MQEDREWRPVQERWCSSQHIHQTCSEIRCSTNDAANRITNKQKQTIIINPVFIAHVAHVQCSKMRNNKRNANIKLSDART